MSVAAQYLDHSGVEIAGSCRPGYADILTPAALAFLAELHRRFDARRRALLQERVARQARFDAGELPDFLPETRLLRESDWTVAEIPELLRDRRVEITGPVERKMIINALNSGANVFMADFEDSTAPTWDNLIEGQINLCDAVAGTIEHRSADGREYRLGPDPAILMVRPRGWHLPEKHACVDGELMSGALFDVGLYIFHNAKTLHDDGRGPYLYLPKLQSHREAALWDEVIEFAESGLQLPRGAIKATVLIETLPAVFEMHEILHALRRRCVGLNCGRWDYIFSYIKTFRRHPDRVLPERGQVAMTVPFLKAYSELLIQTCHRRGALAMGGMAAQIPINDDADANEAALARVRADKLREVMSGHDGTWVAHPGLIPVARQIFDAHMPTSNQMHIARADIRVTRDDLIAICNGTITRAGFLNNIDVCVRYMAAWFDGQGCVPIHHLMEDAATAEIARAQLWQWLHAGPCALDDGTRIDFAVFDAALLHVHERLPASGLPGQTQIAQAASLLGELTHANELADFLTLPAYAQLA
ncbi:MAG: malate synthase A [Xanthomonadaceae bacterium]|nr:malate synthase A [Xanthomonadaceae bacterium]